MNENVSAGLGWKSTLGAVWEIYIITIRVLLSVISEYMSAMHIHTTQSGLDFSRDP